VQIGNEKKHVIGYLGDFLFAPERARSPVRSLSGGERNRLLLARLFARPANVLVLDEPTNDLDIETLELLEQLLQDYPGTLFLVSHDRAFLDNVVTQTIAAEGEGCWREYAGGYQDWADVQARTKVDPAPESARRGENARAELRGEFAARGRDSGRKLGYREARELAGLPEQIGALESEQKEIALRLEAPALYRTDPRAANTLSKRLAEIDEALMALLERWEELENQPPRPG
jgi:ATP-binding cassette subfamily F protein uup